MTCRYGSTFITGSPWQEGCGEIVWNASQEVDVVTLIGASSAFITSRGNIQERIPVPVTLMFPNEQAALEYCVNLPWSLPPQGMLDFTDGALKIRFEKAAFVNVERQRKGSRVDLVYEFAVSGPPIFNPPPDPLTITLQITEKTYLGYTFEQWLEIESLPTGSILKAVGVEGVLTSVVGVTYTSDLTIFVGTTPPNPDLTNPPNSILQIGGETGLTNVRYYWDNGYDNAIGTPINSIVDVSEQNVILSNTDVYVGNGWYQDGGWTATITLFYQPPA